MRSGNRPASAVQEGCDLGYGAAVPSPVKACSHPFPFWIEGGWVNEEVPVVFSVCCSRCGYWRRRRETDRRPFGGPAEARVRAAT